MDAFVGEIRAVGFPFVPRGWLACDGSLLPINRSSALFSILGTTYGGDGRSTFALPDLRGRALVNAGQGPGLSSYPLGTRLGSEMVQLTTQQIPAHTHTLSGTLNVATGKPGTSDKVDGNYLSDGAVTRYGENNTAGLMAADMIVGMSEPAGGQDGGGAAQPHNNMMPYLSLFYIICVEGIYPQRP